MTPDLAHWLVTTVLGAFVAIIAWIFTSTRSETLAKIATVETNMNAKHSSLEVQNASQERELATLRAQQAAHDSAFDRLSRSIERLDDKLEELTRYLAGPRRITPPPFTPPDRK